MRRRFAIFFVVGALEMLFLGVSGFNVATNLDTPEFCGQTCHTVMRPEYTAYTNSPHARVYCVRCHIGEGASWFVRSKLSGVSQVFATVLNTYERPITTPVEHLRPARDTCERCHWPQRFSGDLVRFFPHFRDDERNTSDSVTWAFRVGGGGLDNPTGIHWHVASKVWYWPSDIRRQDVAWVQVKRPDGTEEEFVDAAKPPTASDRVEAEKREMDCIDCHNRATHQFRSPNELLDNAIAQGRIDRNLPFIKKRGLELLSGKYASLEEADQAIEALPAFYRQQNPEAYSNQIPQIEQAVEEMKRLARLLVFPEMKVDWKTHVDNVGHLESAGCFRCHGKLVDSAKKPIDANCNLCHYRVQDIAAPATQVPAAPGATVIPPTPTPMITLPGTFPGAAPSPTVAAPAPTTVAPSGPRAIPHTVEGRADCLLCHGPGALRPVPASHTGRTNQTCQGCHQPKP